MQSSKKGTSNVGRPRFHLDLSEVEKLCAIGCTHQEIADWLRVSKRTIDYWLADEDTKHQIKNAETGKIESATLREIMDRGYARMKIGVRRQQIKLLGDGNATMAVWLGKQVLGQKDKIQQEVTTKKDGMTLAELLEVYARFDKDDNAEDQ